MNHKRREAPWALEKTPMPASGGQAGNLGLEPGSVNLDTVDAFARNIGFDTRYQLNLPGSETGVWTLSRDSMNTDSTDPMSDRTVHIDQYSGKILADIRFQEYTLAGKAMAVGIALHMGTLGLWSVIANSIICLAGIFLCTSSIVLWWKRYPANAGRLCAPPMPKELPLWQGAALVGLAVSMVFPMAGLALLTVLALDSFLLSSLPKLRRILT